MTLVGIHIISSIATFLSKLMKSILLCHKRVNLNYADQQLTKAFLLTFHLVIPVIDSLENAIYSINRDAPSINALCERLLNSLDTRFSYLLESPLHLAATALHPTVKLSFTDNASYTAPRKKFVCNSTLVNRKLKELLPSDHNANPLLTSSQHRRITPSSASGSRDYNTTKKPKLLDYSSVSLDAVPTTSSGAHTELQSYFDQPRIRVDPVQFWAERNKTDLSQLALQLFSIPSRSAPVERLFSNAGLVLSQRRSRLSSSRVEQLLFSKQLNNCTFLQ